ncbi:hypothetical protein ACDY96_25965 [Rhizobium mongolense]|uniref:hypothetical protein n=1 Tax=Rhizobium mongolense TaxID=57676 RepID=UPI0035566CCA
MKDAWIYRGPAQKDMSDEVHVAWEDLARNDGMSDPPSGCITLSGSINAGGKGRTKVTIEIASSEFETIVYYMFQANRDRAIRAFAKCLLETQPISPIDIWDVDHLR